MTRYSARLMAMLALSAAAQPALAAPAACLSPPEASALARAVMPGAVTSLAEICGPTLSDGAYLRRNGAALAQRLTPASNAALPLARTAFARTSGMPMIAKMKDETIRDLMVAGVGEQLATLKPRDCRMVDRAFALLAPLPAESYADLLVFFIEIGSQRKSETKSPLNLCPAA